MRSDHLYKERVSRFLPVSRAIKILLGIFITLSLSITSFAEQFSAKSLADYGNVTVMEVIGNYDANNADGTVNAASREIIAKEFYQTHKDEYDFLVVFTNFDFQMPDHGDARAFYLGVKNDIQGIGKESFDNTSLFGSTSKLQGTIDMGNLTRLATDPLDPKFKETLYILSHELLHRWGADLKLKNSDGSLSIALLGKDGSHWSFLFDSGGSVLYGNRWLENGNGTFTSTAPQDELKFYSPLDLYLMGMIDKSKVPPMLLIDSIGVDAGQVPQGGVTINGTAKTVTIDDIIAANGPRYPDAASSQKAFKTAFIYITTPGTFSADAIYEIENIRNGFVTRHSILTDGKSIVEVASFPKEDLPVNPGVLPPSTTPRTTPSDIDEGVQWLMTAQRGDGSWQDLAQTVERDTAEVVAALKNFSTAQQNYQAGLLWLGTVSSGNLDYLARKIEALIGAGQDASPLVQDLLASRNADGGWGSETKYPSGIADTALALRALSETGFTDPAVLTAAVNFLKSKQNSNNGWGGDDKESMVRETSVVLSVLNRHRSAYQLESMIASGTAWLVSKQNGDGGFGNSPSTVYDTAIATLALRELNVSTDITNKALAYILGQQSNDGSWNQSASQTALAITAVFKATVDPDLSVKTDDVTVFPATITSLPSNIVINANIANLGQTGTQAKVALYEGSITDANKLGEQILTFPGQSSTSMTFSATARDGSEHRFIIVVDPDNQVKESNELNNSSIRILSPEATYDLEVLPGDVTAAPNTASMLQDVKITAKISNKGTMNAYNARVKYFIGESGNPYEMATQTVDVPAGSTITNEVTWRANKAGTDMQLVVQVDPYEAEISVTNNKAATTITVNTDTRPNLDVSYKDIVITPSPGNERGTVTISALIKNDGFSPANNIVVRFYRDVPCTNQQLAVTMGGSCSQALLIGTQTIATLGPGENSRVSVDWIGIPESGNKLIYVEAYPADAISEIADNDNYNFVTTFTLRSLPDLAISTNSIVFSPAAPKEGDPVTVTVTVQNKGEQTASNVVVRLSESGTVFGSQTISSLAGNSTTAISLPYNTTGRTGVHTIMASIDPDNVLIEQSEDNNIASRALGVQDASLWVTEQYISPNGDGVKDSTQFFFRMETAATVSVRILNRTNETVRTFAGPELANTAGASIVWDGLNDAGAVVDDGEYQLQVLDSTGNILAIVRVVVDNNRSPLANAIGTKYLLNNNLTCMLPGNRIWQWFPDESGILMKISGTPEYANGIYHISPDGADTIRLTPADWNNATNPEFQYVYGDYQMAPDGGKIVFSLTKSNNQTGYHAAELWLMDSDGAHLSLLDTVIDEPINYGGIYDVQWSPRGDSLVYRTYSYKYSLGWVEDLWIIKSDGTGKSLIDSGFQHRANNLSDVIWSPDSSQIAYVYGTYDANRNYFAQIKVTDLMGNKQQVFGDIREVDYAFINYLSWLNQNKLILSIYDLDGRHIWLVNPNGNSDHTNVGKHDSNQYLIWPAPGGKFFSYTPEGASGIAISDGEGNTYTRNARTGWNCAPKLSNVVWSLDGAKIAFSERLGTLPFQPACIDTYGPHVIVFDANTKQEQAFASAMTPLVWMSSGRALLGNGHGPYDDLNEWSIVLWNLETGQSSFSHMPQNSYFINSYTTRLVSPHERYISYYQRVDPSSVCAAVENKHEDLWTLGSIINLAADLRIVKQQSTLLLKGIAADLHFEGYRLEYADIKTPDLWTLVQPESNIPVVNDTFATWIPPYEGSFFIRLSVWDKAGNIAVSKKRVSWGASSSITNLYKSREIFSPKADPVKNTVELYYKVLEPVHLEFNIYDESNNPVKTYYKDHTAPATDFIQWDGTDEALNVVPDGKYKIKVFDYEFFVEVDSTPPRVAASFGSIYKDEKTGGIAVDLNGYVIDRNIKIWALEYGIGDNPQEWLAYVQGTLQLVKNDAQGNPAVDPAEAVTIATFAEQGLGFLAGKKLRMSAEDHAGNRSTAITDFVEETVFFDRYAVGDKELKRIPSSALNAVVSELAGVGRRIAGGLITVRSPLASIAVQLWRNRQWSEASAMTNDPVPGMFQLAWDNAGEPVEAVRIKAVDIEGREYYSNILKTANLLSLKLCPLRGQNSLYESLQALTVQVKSSNDNRYSQWTTLAVYTAPNVPVGLFDLPLHDSKPGMDYTYRMFGAGVSGIYYETSEVDNSAQKCASEDENIIGTLSENDFSEMECGVASHTIEMTLRLENINSAALFKTLSYVMVKPEGLELLRAYDFSREGWGGVSIDTSKLPEGSYRVKAIVSYVDTLQKETKEFTAEKLLTVDRQLPIAQITYPTTSTQLCPLKISDITGDWRGVHVDGKATDNIRVRKYALYFGIGENPAIWLPAMTRKDGKNLHIQGAGPVQGQIGLWDVTGINAQTVSLKLEVVDWSGSKSCYRTSFSIKPQIEIPVLAADKTLFSPNNAGVFDSVTANYEIDEYAAVDVETFRLLASPTGYVLDASPVRTLRSGMQHVGGTGSVRWDGKADTGAVVQDGFYGIVVAATDQCGGSMAQKWVAVEVDNTPPTLAITQPGAASTLGILIVEVKGTVDDLHFQNYTLWRGQEEVQPNEWTQISSGTLMVKDSILGKWNTSGLTGRWTLRLTATDSVGNNREVKVPVTLVAPVALIKKYEATPGLISPNNNGKLETTDVKYEISDAAEMRIEILDSSSIVRNTITTTKPAPGTYVYNYAGQDSAGKTLPDGPYSVKLTVTSLSNPSVSQTEAVTLIIDTTPPGIDLAQPSSNSYLSRQDVAVTGTISDPNIAYYSMNYSGASGTAILDQANQSRTNYTFGTMNALPEGDYALAVRAKDLGENETVKNVTFTIDRTPPAMRLDTPKDGEYYGANNNITINGSLVEKNLDVFDLRYGAGDNPSQWTDLVTGATATPFPSTHAWRVGKNDNIPDGVYTLSLFARDKAGLANETKVKVTIDNTAPTASLTSHDDGDYVKQAADIKGAAFDQNLDKYTLEISEGQCASAFKWAQLKSAAASVQAGLLGAWQALPTDGDYCLRLTVLDKVGLTAESKVNVKVDTHPPAAPALSGNKENKTDVKLIWQSNAEPDIAGYNIYRNGQQINTGLVSGEEFLDQNLPEGNYDYMVKAIDLAGWESQSSNVARMKIDLTGPAARIRTPQDGAWVGEIIDIKGAVYSEDDFKQYRLSIGQGASPSSWNLIRTSPLPVSYGVLANWDTIGLGEGQVYSLKLEAEDTSGNISVHQIQVMIDNTAPHKPATPAATVNNADVTLSWNANTDLDLAGYLLYRNDQLANVTGVVVGDLKPYLITPAPGTVVYLDKNLPDGIYKYSVIAVDKAGNMSVASGYSLDMTLDTRAPQISIADPAVDADKRAIIDGKVKVKAVSPDLDIVNVKFEYKRALDTAWTPLGASVTMQPYVTFFDPTSAGLGLVYGDYHLRAIAADRNRDGYSPMITLTYTDLTPPPAPLGLSAKTTGGDVSLAWVASTDADTVSYNVYRTSGIVRTRINQAVVQKQTVSYTDTGLTDGLYTYEITALDANTNESKPAGQVSAKIYAPVITQPATPATQKTIRLAGSNATAGAAVEIFVDDGAGYGPRGTTLADQAGSFSSDVVLAPGQNRITVKATDGNGNVSRASAVAFVVYDPVPAAPTSLAGSVSGPNVSLSWNESTETDLAGYLVYRNAGQTWVKVTPTAIQSLTYNDVYLPNGTYSYYISAQDHIGSESQRSNEVSVTLSLDPPQPPVVLSVSPTPTSGLVLLWEHPGAGVAGYNIYRSAMSGGPYERVNGSPVLKTPYSDTGLVNGSPYYYVVTAIDQAGNQSVYSNEAMGTPADTVAPAKPFVLSPTTAGRAVTTFKRNAEIAGLAEAGTTVEVFKNGAFAGSAPAVKKDVIQNVSIGAIGDPAICPDGSSLAFTQTNKSIKSIRLKDLVSGETTTLIDSGWQPVWSGDGSKIAYSYRDAAGSTRLGMYYLADKTKTPLTSDVSVYEYGPSLSLDGNRIAYNSTTGGTSNIWFKDLTSGSATKVTDNAYVYTYRLSPDGMKLAYIATSYETDETGLYLYDVAYGVTSLIHSSPQTYYLDWTADSTKIVFVSSISGYYKMYVYDITSAAERQVTETVVNEYNPRWSPDGQNIAYVKNGNELWVASALSGETRQVAIGYYFQYLTWLKSGEITFIPGSDLYKIFLERGYFTVSDVPLDPGENPLSAVSKDNSGNTSEISESITVIYDTSKTPDVSIATGDVSLYPPLPLAGDQVTVGIAVANNSQVEIKDVDVDVYLWSANGQLELLRSERISSLAPGSTELVSAAWDSTGKIGENRLVIVLDSEDEVAEFDETNNMAIKDFFVAAQEGVISTTKTDAAQYGSQQAVTVGVTLRNSGPPKDTLLQVQIEDENGYPVSAFEFRSVTLAYATTSAQSFSWNTGSTYAGPYVVHSVLKDASSIVIAENLTPFTIVSDAAADLTVVTNKIAYGPQENIAASFIVKNIGTNSDITALQAKVIITDALGTVLFNEIKNIPNLLPGSSINLSSLWNTGLNSPGEYLARIEVSFDNSIKSSKTTSFRISAMHILKGTVTSAQSALTVGTALQASYTVTNDGNIDTDPVTAEVLLIDPETGEAKASVRREGLVIRRGETVYDSAILPTAGLPIKTYSLVLRTFDGAAITTLATALVSLKDLVPPTVTVITPINNNVYTSSISLSARASDASSGVEHMEYQQDDGSWSLMPPADPSTGRFGAVWEPTMDDDGPHTVRFRATDKAGNTSVPVQVLFFVDINRASTAPSLAAPADGSDVGVLSPVLIVNNASDPNNDPLTYEFELYTDSGLQQRIAISNKVAEGAGVTSWQAPELVENVLYFWRCRAHDGMLYGPWTEVASFRVNSVEEPPAAPIVSSPLDGSEVATLTPSLSISNAIDPDSTNLTYNYEVALDPDFIQIADSVVGIASGAGTTSWQVPADRLQENTWYYWRAQADDWFMAGPWSTPAARFFVNTSNEAPSIPVMQSPGNGAVVRALETDIVLTNSIDPDSPVISYFFEIDAAISFDSPDVARSGAVAQGNGTTTWNISGLRENTRYYVRAKASDGQTESAWSPVVVFSANAVNEPPTAPVLANPSNGAGVMVFTPTFSVVDSTDPDGDALSYEFEIYSDQTLTTFVTGTAGVPATAETTQWTTLVPLMENHTYYWRARVFDGQVASSWTASASFTVNTADDPPGSPTLVSPADGGSVATLAPVLSVLNAIDPDSTGLTYDFEIYAGNELIQSVPGVAQDSSGMTSAALNTALVDNTVYQWRARAYDGQLYGPWTSMAGFTVHLPQTGIVAQIDFEPETLNKKSHETWVKVEIELPHGFDASDIDISSIRLEGTVRAEPWPHQIKDRHRDHGCDRDHKGHNHSELTVKFRRSEVIAVLPMGEKVPVHVTGTVGTTTFDGVDIIRVIN